jgi:hypothetical protein
MQFRAGGGGFGKPFDIFWQFRVKGFASRGWELEWDFDVVPGGRRRIRKAIPYFLAVH